MKIKQTGIKNIEKEVEAAMIMIVAIAKAINPSMKLKKV